jgi:hypothetical protein
VGSRSSSVSGLFQGSIDEVMVFTRALDGGECSELAFAGSVGIPKHYCQLPWASAFCVGASQITVTANICNAGAADEHFYYWFQGQPSDGTPLTVDGPTGFSYVSPSTILVPAGKCVPVQFKIARPPGLNGAGLTASYHMYVMTAGTNEVFCGGGSVRDTGVICPISPGDPATLSVGNATLIGPMNLTNAGSSPLLLGYQLLVYDGTMSLDTNAVSLNGLPPGSPITGVIPIPSGATVGAVLSAMFVLPAPLETYTIVLKADLNADSILDPIATMALECTIPVERPLHVKAAPPMK